jgi:hypothetical protein
LDEDYTVCHGSEGLPLENDPIYSEYEFSPKPPDVPPLIPHMILLHIFDEPECAKDSSKILTCIPKRVHGELPVDVHVAWGVQLQQDLCNLRVCFLLVAIGLAAAIADCWISGYPRGLQKSTVLITAFFAVVVILVAILLPNAIHYRNLPRSTTNSSRTYKDSKHNEYKGSTFDGRQIWP